MTQASDLGQITNQAAVAYRARVNANLQALATAHYGAVEPNPAYPNMLWFDQASGSVKLRDPTNTAWAVVASIGPPFRWTAVGAHPHDGADLTSGTIAAARLGLMTAATATAAGAAGAVPAPPAGAQSRFLRGDGTFGEIASLFTKEYVSPQTTITSGGITFTHDLGALPKVVQLSAVCISAEQGFSVGDRILVPAGPTYVYGLAFTGPVVLIDASQIRILLSTNGGTTRFMTTVHRSSFNYCQLANAAWKLICSAWA